MSSRRFRNSLNVRTAAREEREREREVRNVHPVLDIANTSSDYSLFFSFYPYLFVIVIVTLLIASENNVGIGGVIDRSCEAELALVKTAIHQITR